MKRKQYANVRQLEDDIKWFVHNCRTIFAQGCEIREASDGLIDYVNLHIQLIQACTHCYEDACVNSMSCSKHLLVWAKVKGHRYWPAKMMAVKVEKRKGYVRFFGDGAMDILSVDDCFLYSKNYPDHKKFYPTKLYNKAIKVSLKISYSQVPKIVDWVSQCLYLGHFEKSQIKRMATDTVIKIEKINRKIHLLSDNLVQHEFTLHQIEKKNFICSYLTKSLFNFKGSQWVHREYQN